MHGGLTARQWWNRLKDYNPHIAKRYVKERPHLTAKQIAGLQNTGKLIGKVNTPKTNGKCTNGTTKAKATKAKATKPTKAKATKATKAKPNKATAKASDALRKRGGKVFLSKGKMKWRPCAYLSGISDAELRHYGLGPSKWYK